MKINRFRMAVASLVMIVGAGVVGDVALTKPEAAEPLIWALVLMGLARVGVAVFKSRQSGRPALANTHHDIVASHGEIA